MLGYCHDIILPPQVKSDVTTTDADREGRDWYPKIKFVPDILKKNNETKLVGEGHKINLKTLIANILKENDTNNIIAEGHKQYHKTKEVGGFMPSFMDQDIDPACNPYTSAVDHCMLKENESEDDIKDCAECIGKAWGDVALGEVVFIWRKWVFVRIWRIAFLVTSAMVIVLVN